MRLVCPNCDAQYEVVDDVIPAEGRDVQCSNCGQTWFQHHPDHAPKEAQEDVRPDGPVEDTDAPVDDEERVPAPPTPERRAIDNSVADILRQEAELEAKARASEALESQPELGLQDAESDADRRAREARTRMAKMRGEVAPGGAVSEAAATAAALGSRRDLLPDIEEINSTLRSEGDRQSGAMGPSTEEQAMPASAAAKSGFRRGFVMMVLLAVILGAVYVFAPQIAQAIPQVDPYLNSYVAFVDSARTALDARVTSVLTWLDGLAAAQGE